MKNLLKLICFLFLCFSCQEQEVVSGMQANSGVLNQDFYSKLNFLEKTVPSDENQIVSIVLSNTGNYPISDLVIEKLPSPVSFYGDIYPGTGGDCSDVIQSESSCTLVFEVDLEHEVQEKTHIFVKYHNGVQSKELKIDVDVKILTSANLFASMGEFLDVTSALASSESPVRFPETKLGGRTESIITLGNSGQRDLLIKNLTFGEAVLGFTGGSFPGVNGDCTTRIKSLEVCKVEVFYEPLEEETINRSMVFEINNGISDELVNIDLNFESTDDRAKISFSISQVYDLGDFVLGDKKVLEFMLMNARIVSAKDISVSIDNTDLKFTGGTFPGINGTCASNELDALSFCTVEVEYSADSFGESLINFDVHYNDNNEFTPLIKTANISFSSSTFSGAQLALNSALSLNGDGSFGNQELGKTKTHGISVENTGDFDASVTGFEIVNNDDGVFSVAAGGSCGSTIKNLSPTKLCTAYVSAKGDVVGNYNANLKVYYNNGLNTGGEREVIIPLTVNVLATSNVTLSGNSSFGVLPRPSSTNRSRTFTLANSKEGSANLTFDFNNILSSDFTVNSNTCGASLAFNSTCSLTITYDPASTGSDYNYVDVFIDDSFKSYKIRIGLSGEARSHADLKMRDRDNNNLSLFDFQTEQVGSVKEMFFTLKNVGGYTASSIVTTLSGSVFSLSGISCSPSMDTMALSGSGNSGSSCSFMIRFSPDSAINYNETLTFNYYNGENTTTLTIPLSGKGGDIGFLSVVDPVKADYYSLGSGLTGELFSFTFTLENLGTKDITSIAFVETATYLSWGTSTCSGNIPAGSQCNVEVFINTSNPGSYKSTMIYSYESEGELKEGFLYAGVSIKSPPNLSLSIQGQGVANSFKFEDAPIGQQSYVRFSISNSGQTDANNLQVSMNGDSQFSYTALDCSNSESIPSNLDCDFYLIYTPDSETENSGAFNISFDNADVMTLNVSGNGISPGSLFNSWNEISAISDNSSGTVSLKWKPMTAVNGAVINGYSVYSSDIELPMDKDSLEAFKVGEVNETLESNLVWNSTGLEMGKTKYYAIRAMYEGGVLSTDDTSANIKVIIPPKNMSMIHPYIANQDHCRVLNLEPEKDNSFGCNYSGLGNVDGKINLNKILLVDKYELASSGSSSFTLGQGLEPALFGNVISASQACTSQADTVDSVEYSKSLIRRSEFIIASKWGDDLSESQIEDIEDGDGQNCYINASSADTTGQHANCISKYGIFDMIGNLWEWNSDSIENRFGGISSVDSGNNEMYSLYLSNMLPGEIRNEQCFSIIFGLPQGSNGGCSNETMSDEIEDLVGKNYFWPPLGNESRSIRSGGGIGSASDEQSRVGGRFVVDMNQLLSSNTPNTGARCVLRFDI